MDPASAAGIGFKAYEVGGITLLLVFGFGLVIFGVWRSSVARETRMQTSLDKAMAACEQREAAIAERLTEVESNHNAELRAYAQRVMDLTESSFEVSARSSNAIENSTRVTERVLARLDKA